MGPPAYISFKADTLRDLGLRCFADAKHKFQKYASRLSVLPVPCFWLHESWIQLCRSGHSTQCHFLFMCSRLAVWFQLVMKDSKKERQNGRTLNARLIQGRFDFVKWFWSKSHVQMVCGLIQEEDMRIYKGDQQHHNLCIHLLSKVNGKTICPPLLWPNKFLTCVLPLALHPCSHSILGSVLNGKENTLQPCICIYD